MSEDNRFSNRKKNTIKRNQRIVEEYNRLYNQERIRHDDVVEKLSEMFCLSESTINRILSKDN